MRPWLIREEKTQPKGIEKAQAGLPTGSVLGTPHKEGPRSKMKKSERRNKR